MTAPRAFVTVSGLPACGKTTLARALAPRLGLPVIDKDVILESLYDSLGIGDQAWRHRLSRSADDVLYALAADAGRAVLVNWWHRDTAPGRLRALGGRLVEVHCACDTALAAERFRARARHPGHLDRELTAEQLDGRVAAWAAQAGPLGLGERPVVVDTTRPVVGAALTALAEGVGALL
ncbi:MULTISPECIES: AAA family ATPase [Streptomyces]|uniref:AAA family ATPase n=1 Tax=Streptomyces TaxID=1883 RepID=UPI000464C6F4|nr:AAA family ATPase [Streptomyces exfoliatus]